MADHVIRFSCLLGVGTPDNAARPLDLYNELSEERASEEPPSEGWALFHVGDPVNHIGGREAA